MAARREDAASPSHVHGDALSSGDDFCEIWGNSSTMRAVLRSICALLPHARTVLITGETGTGKELVARAVHRLGTHGAHPMTRIYCAAAGPSELDQVEIGAGTTILLDEVQALSPASQASLQRVLDRHDPLPADSAQGAVIATTDVCLLHEVARGRFSEDLRSRLDVFAVNLPPLRDRPEDIAGLSQRFLARTAETVGRGPMSLTPEAEWRLRAERWPGNVRQLENVLLRASIASDGPSIDLTLVERALTETHGEPASAIFAAASAGSPWTLADLERDYIGRELNATERHQCRSTATLGPSRRSLFRKPRRVGLA